MPGSTGPLTYDRLRQLGLPGVDVDGIEQQEREQAAQLAADAEWARVFLERCGIDPDDPADVRSSFEAAREGHAKWLTGRPSEIDAEAYCELVYAVRALYGWVHWPLDWPAPTLVLMDKPLRNLLSRTP